MSTLAFIASLHLLNQSKDVLVQTQPEKEKVTEKTDFLLIMCQGSWSPTWESRDESPLPTPTLLHTFTTRPAHALPTRLLHTHPYSGRDGRKQRVFRKLWRRQGSIALPLAG